MRHAILLSLLLLPGLAAAQAPQGFGVASFSHSGIGCPAGSVAIGTSPDGMSFTLLFDQLVAAAGPGVDPEEAHSRCDLRVLFNVPAGWSFGVEAIDFRGYAQLDAGVRATQRSQFHFLGGRGAHSTVRLDGPIEEDYVRRAVSSDSSVASACRGPRPELRILADSRVHASGEAGGQLTVDSVDGAMAQVYQLRFKRCN